MKFCIFLYCQKHHKKPTKKASISIVSTLTGIGKRNLEASMPGRDTDYCAATPDVDNPGLLFSADATITDPVSDLSALPMDDHNTTNTQSGGDDSLMDQSSADGDTNPTDVESRQCIFNDADTSQTIEPCGPALATISVVGNLAKADDTAVLAACGM